MKVEIKTNEVLDLPCLMKNNMNQIVLVTTDGEKNFVTVIANTDGSNSDVGKTWESDFRRSNYLPLPAGYQVTITN